MKKRSVRTVVPYKVEREELPGAIRFVCLGAEPPGLNGSEGHFATHWSKRKKDKDRLKMLLRSGGPLPSFKGKVTVRYTRTYRHAPMDEDNLLASFKLVGDALVKLGIIEDDKRSIMRLVPAQEPRGELGARYEVEVLEGWQ